MLSRISSVLLAIVCLVPWGRSARADFLEISLPNSSLKIVLEGRITKGRTVTLQHKFGKLYFGANDVEIYKVPTNPALFGRMAGKARASKDAEAMFEAAKWAVRHALPMQFSQAIEQTLELAPKHAGALRIKTFQEKIAEPLPESPEEEKRIRAVLDRKSMRIARSKHFIMLHDTNAAPPKSNIPGARRRPPRALERLRLLEEVYETFLMTFTAAGIELDIPQQRMQVILFSEIKDFQDFSQALSPTLTSAVGFWDPNQNVSVFFDNATDEVFEQLEELLEGLREQAKAAKRRRGPDAARIVRSTNTLDLMVSAAQERSDIKVVTHEATHQMAGNTGLFPRHVRIPSWAHEGLATYFETPADATWSGVGAVNESRLRFFRALSEHATHSNIDFVVTDQIFKLAASHGATLHAYAQAWALTHFLMENHFEELMKYYAFLAQMPPDVTLNPDVLLELFDRAFGDDREKLTLDWRAYMRTLKTDYEQAIESAR